ncbi:MAG: methyltransferase domain-containing protein [Deltaproteobacteria bacterium]|nr:methyltransferase domain-containing protein [Deltaproteobacteria bacterium]
MDHLESIKEYYGKILKSNQDLKTTACCSVSEPPAYLKTIVKKIHPEISERFYGCGSPIPPELEGCTILDMGCGSGRDAFILSNLVGKKGHVIGIDMTQSQLDIANQHKEYHRTKFEHEISNVEFKLGYMEELESLGIKNDSIDVIISNCVFNLSPHKEKVFKEIFRVLKPGGELYFSDVFSSRRIPESLAQDPILRGECLGGALYIEDFRRVLKRVGCFDFRIMSKTKVELSHFEIKKKIGSIDFCSITIRAFKLSLEDQCEDYGQVGYYLGTLPEFPHEFQLDDHHMFKRGRPLLICGNTADMISKTRYQKHFKIVGTKEIHYGLFDCTPKNSIQTISSDGACC